MASPDDLAAAIVALSRVRDGSRADEAWLEEWSA